MFYQVKKNWDELISRELFTASAEELDIQVWLNT